MYQYEVLCGFDYSHNLVLITKEFYTGYSQGTLYMVYRERAPGSRTRLTKLPQPVIGGFNPANPAVAIHWNYHRISQVLRVVWMVQI